MTTTTTDVVAADQDRDKRRRRAAIVRFGLASVAVLGVGAAATSAAWTDDAWFAGGASAVEKVELQASVDGQTWYDADAADAAVQIPADAFADLNQGADETITLYLKNDSTVPLTLGKGVLTADGALFAGTAPATATIHDPSSFELAAGATDAVVLQITTPDDWPEEYQGTTGTLTLQFTGES